MAAIDYAGILDELKTIFEADSRTADAHVYVEEDPQFGLADTGKSIVLTLDSRAPSAGQSMSAGTRTRYAVTIGVWTLGFHMESFREAARTRDELLAQVELVLMANRTVSGKVTAGQLAGGQFLSVLSQGATPAFAALAETRFRVEVSAIN